MKNFLWKKQNLNLLGAALILSLSACGDSKSSNSNDSNEPTSENPSTPNESRCGIVFDKTQMERAGLRFPLELDGYIFTTPPQFETCDSSRTENDRSSRTHSEGYSSLIAYRAIYPLSTFSISEGERNNSTFVDLQVDTQFEATEEAGKIERKALAQKLGANMERYSDNSINAVPSIQFGQRIWAVYSNGIVTSAQILSQNQTTILRVPTPHGIPAKTLVELLNTEKLSLKLYHASEIFYGSSSVFAETRLSIEGSRADAQILNSKVTNLINDLWNSTSTFDRDEKANILIQASTLLKNFPTPSARVALKEIFDEANQEWSSIPETISDYRWSHATLHFLNAVVANHSTSDIISAFNNLVSAGMSSNAKTLEESIWLTRRSNLSIEEQTVLINTYKILKNLRLPIEDSWEEAKATAAQNSYNLAQITESWSRIGKFYEWLKSYSGPYLSDDQSLAKAKDYAQLRKLSDKQFANLKTVFEWMKSYSGPYITDQMKALEKSEDLGLIASFNDTHFTFIKNIFAWLISYSGPYITDKTTALDTTLRFSNTLNISPSKFELLKETFAWIISYSGPYISDKTVALQKAERFVLSQSLNSKQMDLMKSGFAWLISYSGPYLSDKVVALEKVDSYVINKKMTDAQLSALQKAFATHHQASRDKNAALIKAETDVFGR